MRKIVVFLGLFFMVSPLAGLPAGAQESYTFNFSQFVPDTHPATQQCQAWARQIEIRSAGTVKFKHYPASTLVKPQDAWDATVKGVCDISTSVFSYTPGRFPVMTTLELPLGYCSGAQAAKVSNEFYKKLKPAETKDVKVLFVFAHSPGYFHTNKPIEKMEDLKGLRIRSTGTTAKIVEALGGVPVAMPQTEVYNALSKNIVDGNLTAFEPLKSLNHANVVKFTTVTPATAYTAPFFVVMNTQKWNALPQSIRDIFDQVSDEWAAYPGETWDSYDVFAKAHFLSLGGKVSTLSAQETERWRQALKPLFDGYIKELDEKGINGKEAVGTAMEMVKTMSKGLCP
jgi:TRAP-type C4-dicarboxylate transport system substrate-binding protein